MKFAFYNSALKLKQEGAYRQAVTLSMQELIGGYKNSLRDFEYKIFNMKSCMTLLGHSFNMK